MQPSSSGLWQSRPSCKPQLCMRCDTLSPSKNAPSWSSRPDLRDVHLGLMSVAVCSVLYMLLAQHSSCIPSCKLQLCMRSAASSSAKKARSCWRMCFGHPCVWLYASLYALHGLTEHISCVCPYLIDLDNVMAMLYNLGLYTRIANLLGFNAPTSWHACFPLYSLNAEIQESYLKLLV